MGIEVASAGRTIADLMPNVNFALSGDIRRALPVDTLAVKADLQNVFEDRVQNIMAECMNGVRVDFVCALRTQFLQACSAVEGLVALGAHEQTDGKDIPIRRELARECSTHLEAATKSIRAATCLGDSDREQLMMAIDHVGEVLACIRKTHVPDETENPGSSNVEGMNVPRSRTVQSQLPPCSVPEGSRHGLDYGFVVRSFPDKGFCFANTPKGEVFVHVSHGSFLETDERYGITSFVRDRDADVPAVGAEIFLSIKPGDRGLRAEIWCTASDLEPRSRSTRFAASRSTPTRDETEYRVIAEYTLPDASKQTTELWSGKGKEALQRRFPKDRHDELKPFSNGDISQVSWIESKDASGAWIRCSDPRA